MHPVNYERQCQKRFVSPFDLSNLVCPQLSRLPRYLKVSTVRPIGDVPESDGGGTMNGKHSTPAALDRCIGLPESGDLTDVVTGHGSLLLLDTSSNEHRISKFPSNDFQSALAYPLSLTTQPAKRSTDHENNLFGQRHYCLASRSSPTTFLG